MKKIIIILITIFSFGFSQTGMMTDDGMGVWLNASVMNIDGDLNDVDGYGTGYALSFDYVMDVGFEIGLDYWIEVDGILGFFSDFSDTDYNPMDLSVMYHIKSDHEKEVKSIGGTISKFMTLLDTDMYVIPDKLSVFDNTSFSIIGN